MKKHVELLAVLLITYSALGLLVLLAVSMLISGVGLLAFVSEDAEGPLAHAIVAAVSVALMCIAILVCVPGIIAGVGLLRMRSWARILTLVVSVFNVLRIPIGTSLSIYAFWVLMKEETIQLFKERAS